MNWSDERYVRVYTRDTTDWIMLPWEARSVFLFLLCKVDRTGALDLGSRGLHEGSWVGLGNLLHVPPDVVQRSIPALIADGCLIHQGRFLIVKSFIEAQEASMSGTMRQQESRLRRRDMIRSGLDPSQRETVIYFIQSEHGGPIKIGRADDLAKRLVGLQTSRPDKLVILAAAPGTLETERELHRRFATIREMGEWFRADAELLDLVRNVTTNGSGAFVTTGSDARDRSQSVTGHSVPDRAVPDRAKEEHVGQVPDVSPFVEAEEGPESRTVERADVPYPAPQAKSKTRSKKPRRLRPEAEQVAAFWIGRLNRKLNSHYEVREKVVDQVNVLLNQGATAGQICVVTGFLLQKWKDNERMGEYCRPSSLLTAEKFGERLDEVRTTRPDWAAKAPDIDAEFRASCEVSGRVGT